jgi:hypothetical protein
LVGSPNDQFTIQIVGSAAWASWGGNATQWFTIDYVGSG